MAHEPVLWMLVGVPASGKSTCIENDNLREGHGRDITILSTDYFIEVRAQHLGKTYNEIFHDTIKDADAKMYRDLEYALSKDHNIIWDQTNINRATRMKKLKKIPSHYKKIAVFFPTPDIDELERRLASRPGKVIPKGVLQNMIDCLTQPMLEEGFNEVRLGN